jgi:hypothetical protein
MFATGVLLLGNHSIIKRTPDQNSRLEPNLDISKIGARIIDELVAAMKDIQLDDEELACIKALVFFDPSMEKLFSLWSPNSEDPRRFLRIFEDFLGESSEFGDLDLLSAKQLK